MVRKTKDKMITMKAVFYVNGRKVHVASSPKFPESWINDVIVQASVQIQEPEPLE